MVDRRNRHLKKNGTNFGWSTHALHYNNNTPFALKAVDGDVVVCAMYLNHSCMQAWIERCLVRFQWGFRKYSGDFYMNDDRYHITNVHPSLKYAPRSVIDDLDGLNVLRTKRIFLKNNNVLSVLDALCLASLHKRGKD